MSKPRQPMDLQARVTAHVAASNKRDKWARKGLEYEKAGKIRKAREALQKAEYWDLKRRELEV